VNSVLDWRRYLGLAMLLGIVVRMVCLAKLATLRNQLRFRNQVWGNLAMEVGVDGLLQVGWNMEVLHLEMYDKLRCIGQDESMLMGEYEELHQPPVGVEITVMKEEPLESVPSAILITKIGETSTIAIKVCDESEQ